MLTSSNVASNSFVSSHGWSLSLPLGWRVLPKAKEEVNFGLDTIEVFAHPQDPSLSLTWMCSSSQLSSDAFRRFVSCCERPAAIPPAEAHSLISSIFPLMGKVATAFAVQLADGQRALEFTEEIASFGGGNEPLRAYHLFFPLQKLEGEPNGTMQMQQLVFYARQSKFAQEIVGVLQSARSFQSTKYANRV